MSGLLSILALGFFLGMRHASDPDHVIAVTTIVARYRTTRGAALIGAVWGLGHTLTILVVGGGIILFSWVIPGWLGLSMELAVGIILILLGVANLRGIGDLFGARSTALAHSERVHSHAHSHGDYVHTHTHGHGPDAHPHDPDRTPVGWLDRHFAGLSTYRLARPLIVGIVHGLAGSAAIALLVLTTIANPRWAVFYLLIFGVGTMVGMMLITAAIALPLAYGNRHATVFAGRIRVASGLVSIAFGCWIAYKIGVVEGLFTGNPRWTQQ